MYILGYIADRSGSWHWGYLFVGSSLILAGFVMFLVAILTRLRSEAEEAVQNGFNKVNLEKTKKSVN